MSITFHRRLGGDGFNMPIFDPEQPPYYRVGLYSDGFKPVLSDTFYNPVQDMIAALYGARSGLSFSIETEEFLKSQAFPLSTGTFGSQLSLLTLKNTQAGEGLSIAGSQGEIGYWYGKTVTPGTPFFFGATEPNVYFGARQFMWCASLRMMPQANVDPVSTLPGVSGFTLGLSEAGPAFIVGSDQTNWQILLDGVLYDTGEPFFDGARYFLVIARRADFMLRFYIGPIGVNLTKVLEKPSPTNLVQGKRYVSLQGKSAGITGMTTVQFDSYSRVVER